MEALEHSERAERRSEPKATEQSDPLATADVLPFDSPDVRRAATRPGSDSLNLLPPPELAQQRGPRGASSRS